MGKRFPAKKSKSCSLSGDLTYFWATICDSLAKQKVIKRLVWQASPGSEPVELLNRQAENSTLGWGSFYERSAAGSWFSTSVFWDAHGTVPETVRICGCKRYSSNLDKAPKMKDSVQLNSWDNFLMNLPSISSEVCLI